MKKVLARQQKTFSRQFKLAARFVVMENFQLSLALADVILIAENSIRAFIELRIQSLANGVVNDFPFGTRTRTKNHLLKTANNSPKIHVVTIEILARFGKT